MAEIQFVADFSSDAEGAAELPEDLTVADFAIYVQDYCLTRNRPPHVRIGPAKDTVFGPVAGLAEWLIENWAPILWETRTPFRTDRTLELEPRTPFRTDGSFEGPVSQKPAIPGMNEAIESWDGYLDDDCDIELMADWQHRHLFGHACSDLAIPSIVIVPEDNSVVLAVGGVPRQMGASVDFVLPTHQERKSPLFVIRKIDFQQEAADFIEGTLNRAAASGKHPEWVNWLRYRWEEAQKDEANPGRRLYWMVGEVSQRRVETLQQSSPDVAEGLQQLLIDCRTASKASQLQPLEVVVREFATGKSNAGHPSKWQTIPIEMISTNQPDFAQGYRLASLVREKLGLEDRPIHDFISVLDDLEVNLEQGCDTAMFRTAAFALPGQRAHIVPSIESSMALTHSASRFANLSALGRLLWRSRRQRPRVCVAQGDHALLSESRRANAFAANLLLPQEVVRGVRLTTDELADLADRYGISYPAAKWHARNMRAHLDESEEE